jgi:hypothetical protein
MAHLKLAQQVIVPSPPCPRALGTGISFPRTEVNADDGCAVGPESR